MTGIPCHLVLTAQGSGEGDSGAKHESLKRKQPKRTVEAAEHSGKRFGLVKTV